MHVRIQIFFQLGPRENFGLPGRGESIDLFLVTVIWKFKKSEFSRGHSSPQL